MLTAADYSGKVAVASLEGWFGHNTYNGLDEYHTGLTAFDGSGLVTFDSAFNDKGQYGNHCTSLRNLFEKAENLETVKGVNTWDTTYIQDYSRAFFGTKSISSLDIRSWHMTNVTNSTNIYDMFTDMGGWDTSHLKSLTLGPGAVLTDSGLGMHPGSNGSCMDADATTFKGETIGRWVMGDPLNLDPTKLNTDVAWFGSNFGLEDRYRFGTGSRQANDTSLTYVHTYTWDNTTVGNHFDSNRNVWWSYSHATGELKIGVFDKNATVEYDKNWTIVYSPNSIGWAHKITEGGPAPTDGSYDALPWRRLGFLISDFRADGTQGKAAPETMESWFESYTTINNMPASQLDLTNTSAWSGSPYVSVSKENDGTGDWYQVTFNTRPNWEQYYTPIYLSTGYTYQLKATMRTISWPTNVGGSTGFEIAYQSYNHSNADYFKYIGFTPRQTTGWTTNSIQFTVSRAGTYYLGFNGGPIADGYTVSVGIRDIELSIVAEFVEFDGTNIDVTHTVSMKNMFKNQNKLHRTMGMSAWNTASLVNTSGMFQNCGNLDTITSVTHWDMSKVTDASFMFDGVGKVDTTNGLSWDVSSLTNAEAMFRNNASVVNANYMARWDVSKITNFKSMFEGCSSMTSVDAIGGWKVGINATGANPVDLTSMFASCGKLEQVDITDWKIYDRADGTHYAIITNLFAGDGALTQLVMGKYGMLEDSALGRDGVGGNALASRAPSAGGWTRYGSSTPWFGTTNDLVSAYTPGSQFLLSEALIYTYIWQSEQTGGNEFVSNRWAWWKFMPDSGTLVIGLNDNTTSDPNYHRWVSERWWELPWFVDITGNNDALYKRSEIKYIEFVGDVHVINPEYWFAGLPNLEKADVAHMHIDVAGSIEGLFGTLPEKYVDDAGVEHDPESIKAIKDKEKEGGKADVKLRTVQGLETWNTEMNLPTTTGAFDGKDTRPVTSAKGMFQGAEALRNVDTVVGWDTATFLDTSFMFDGCKSLTDVSQLATWNTGNVLTMEAMFRNVEKLRVVDGVMGWDTRKVENFVDMFNGCKSVVEMDFSSPTWDLSASVLPSGAYNIENMLANLQNLKLITLPHTFTLAGSGLDNEPVNHKATDGTWEQEAFPQPGTTAGYVAWWGNPGQLVKRYPEGGNNTLPVEYASVWATAEFLTYSWKSGYVGGRFESNRHAWWKYDKNGNLIISVDHVITDGVVNNEFRVWEDVIAEDTTLTDYNWSTVIANPTTAPTGPSAGNYNAPDVPWLDVLSGTDIKKIYMQNQIAPVNPNGWFSTQVNTTTTGSQNYCNLEEFEGSGADMQHATSLADMFRGDIKLKRVSTGLAGWNNMSHATSLSGMFAGCKALAEIVGLDNWDVSHITDFSSMFDMSQHLEATGVLGNDALVQMGNWNIGANVTGSITMKDMFKDLQGITSLTGLAAWDTSKVTDFSGMFSSSKNHKGTVYEYKDGKLNMTIGDKGSMLLDASVVTLWDTSAATTFANMFANAIRLEKVNISSWNMHDKTATDMFLNCAGLNEITLGVNNILDDTAFGPDMFFIETVPTRANGGTHTDVNVYWRSNVDINPDNNKLTYNGVTWQYGNIGGTWFAQDANRPTGNDFTGTNIWSGSTSNLLALYPAPIAPGVQAHKAPAAVTTYKWDDSCYAGVFDSSIAQDSTTGLYYYNSWWRYYKKGDLDKTLVMGTIANAGNHVVTEKNESHKDNGTNNLPWAKYPGANIVANVEHIKTGAVLHEDGTITFDSLLGQISPTNPEGWFYDHNNLKDFDGAGFDTSQATSLSYFLAGCEKLETISNMGGWDVSGITDFSHMFHGDVKLKDISTLSTWVLKNTPGGVNMAYMFADTGITDPGALATNGTYWNVGRVDNMEGMFAGCKEMTTQETIKNWDISRVQTMAGMFRNCAALTTVDLSRWAMKSAGGLTHIGNLNVDGMFEGCSKLGQLTVGESSMLTNTAFNNSLANRGPTDTETGGMWELVKANGVDLPRTSHTTDFLPEGTALWFGSTGSLAERYTIVSSVPGDALTYVWRDDVIGERFKSNPYAWWIYDKGIKLDKDGNPVLDSNKNPVKSGHLVLGLDTGADATNYCRGVDQQTQTYGSLVTEGQDDTDELSASDLPWLFRTFTVSESDSVNNVSKDYTPVARTSIAKVTTQGGIDVRFPANWFRNYTNLEYFDGSGMDVSQATNLSSFFRNDSKLADFVTSAYRWNTSNVTNMSYFMYNTALPNLDMLSTSGANGFNVANVKDLSYAFSYMTKLTDISGLANWQINSSQYAPVNMDHMLFTATKLTDAFPLQNWIVDYANLTSLFNGCQSLHSADLSRWDMRNATVDNMFAVCKVIGDASKGGKLRLGKFSKLALTGLAGIDTRAAKTGMWVRDTSSGTIIDWFGTSNALMDMYKDGSTGVGNAILVPSYLDYIWDDSRLGGRFGSNVNDWWMFFIKDSTYNGEPMRKGTLLLGADQTASNRVVTETANALPWLDDASTPEVDPIVTRDQVWYIKTKYDIAPSNPAEWFKDYVNNVSFDGSGMHITNAVTSLAGMFKNQPKLHTVTGLDSWDVSNVTSLREFFHGDERLTNISGMDAWASKTGKVEDMSGMFYNNDGLVNTNLNQFANWNVSNVRDMSYLLYDADGITDLDALASWRPARVEDLSHAFESMGELTNVNGLRDWAPASSSATTSLKLAYLFAGCTKLTSIEPITGSSANIGANHWNVDKVTDFSYMLYNIADASDKMTITSIDLSQWDMRSNTYRNGNILLTNMLQLSSNAYTDAKDPKDTNFVSFTFGPNTLLYKDSTNNAGLANTPLLTLADGVWIKNTNALGQATSVGNSNDLRIWYDTSVNVPSDITTYTFDPTHLGSVMADNRNIWWTVAKKDTTSVADASVEDKANLLRIGLIGNSKSHATSMLGPNLPWKQALGSVSFWNDVIGFATDGTNGNVAPTTMSQWFASTPAAFTSFDGTYLDTSNVTSFYQAFYNATKLATVTGTGNWNTTSA